MFFELYSGDLGFKFNDYSNYWKKQEKVFNINNFIADGFEKVCNVTAIRNKDKEWKYTNINENLMFSDHKSWVYFIVIDNTIVKCGESGNPLGIKHSKNFWYDKQPITGTKSRFGRLRKGDKTDFYLRESILPYMEQGLNVSLWAKKCPVVTKNVVVAGENISVSATMHKDLEQFYLEHFKFHAGLPVFNKASK